MTYIERPYNITEARKHAEKSAAKSKERRKTQLPPLVRRIGAVAATGVVIMTGTTAYDRMSNAKPEMPTATQSITIEDGTTAWTKATEISKYTGQDPRDVIGQIKELNPGIDFGQLQVNQEIKVPSTAEHDSELDN